MTTSWSLKNGISAICLGLFDGEAFGVFAEGEAETGDEELCAGFGGEEGNLVGEVSVNVWRGGEVERELLVGRVPGVGDPSCTVRRGAVCVCLARRRGAGMGR